MTATTTSSPRLPGAALASAVLWFVLAALAGATGVAARLPFPIPQIAIATLVVLGLVATSAIPALRAWTATRPLRALIGIHALRFVGIVFLLLAARGQLAQVFADRAGWGDIAVATLALVLVAAGDPVTPGRRAVVHVWNILGLLDLIVAVGTATSVVAAGVQPGMERLFSFPLSLVPLFFVPVFLVGHVIIFRRLVAAGRTSRGR